MGHYARDCTERRNNQSEGRLINIDANAHASAFQLSGAADSDSQSSYDSAQERADEWNSYYF